MAVHISLANGERVQINDHVYSAPPWSARDAIPYSIGRIMEFLPPEGSINGKGKGKETFTRVRLAWYYRPGDVSERAVTDSRVLLAAIYSEIIPVSQLRAKCYVRHKDKIADLVSWRKKPDRFYFHRMFDPYIKKEFEVLRSVDIHNLPRHVKDVLVERFEFVVCEKEFLPELTDSLRLCETCGEWCPSSESVQCDTCKCYFHMECVNPPLAAKPSRGYGWACAPCTRRHEERVDKHDGRGGTPTQKPKPKVKAKGKASVPQLNDERESDDRYFKLWPFRYFGQYTVADDTLDPDDLIFPRAATRVGPKFQASVPTSVGEQFAVTDAIERGGDETVEVLGCLHEMSEQQLEDIEKRKASFTSRKDLLMSVDWIEESIRRLSDAALKGSSLNNVSMKNPLRQRKWKSSESRYTDKEWNDEEVSAFESAIRIYGPELRSVQKDIRTRPIGDVVRYYYSKWKSDQLRDENRAAEAGLSLPKAGPSKRHGTTTNGSDDEGSIYRLKMDSSRTACVQCRTRESATWWKGPKGTVMCDNCGLLWRKYDQRGKPAEDQPSAPTVTKVKPLPEKREGTPLVAPVAKRVKTSNVPSAPTPPPAKQLLCNCCKKPGPVGKVIKCHQCNLTIHSGCAGVTDEEMKLASSEQWLCELCQNDTLLESNLNSQCLLCPRRASDEKEIEEKKRPGGHRDRTFLRASKPTEGRGWVHILCSVFMPEVMFTDAKRLRLVEGISLIPAPRWVSYCKICNLPGGAVIRCADCQMEFHISCAWTAGYKFGFEIQPVKSSRRDAMPSVEFRHEAGWMHALVWCDSHSLYGRTVYGLCDTNELDETALEVFCETYKQVPLEQSYGLLRKARRLDSVSNIPDTRNDEDSPPVCYMCRTEHSPLFWPVGSSGTRAKPKLYQCHACHYAGEAKTKEVQNTIEDGIRGDVQELIAV